jgi:predicted MFS family arabinose efflux permease
MAEPMGEPAVAESSLSRVVYLGALVTWFDRFAVAPLLPYIAHTFGVTVGAASFAATVYLALFGGLQVVYGALSDRFGRILLMRFALGAFAIAGTASALSTSFPMLLLSRAAAGATICAVIPTSMVYVSERLPVRLRQPAISDLLAIGAVGTASATLAAGLLASYATWRLAFLLPALAGAVLCRRLGRVPDSRPTPRRGRAARSAWEFLRSRHVAAVVLVGAAEGAAMLGAITYLAPSLESTGQTSAVAGAVTAAYGVAVLAGSRGVRVASRRVSQPWLIALGGGLLVLCFLSAAHPSVLLTLVASVCAGLAYAAMHSTLQTWATEIAPQARGIVTALFATAVFGGAAAATAAMAPAASTGHYGTLFVVVAAYTAPVVIFTALARGRITPPERSIRA